jgi:hypothetical protein
MKRVWVSLTIAVLFLAALPLAAQTGTWTAVGSTGVVDESAAAIYAFGTTNLTFLGNNTGTIVARYNVTNTWGGGALDTPPWSILQMGYLDTNAATSVRADLFRVDPCSGVQTLLCTMTSTDASAPTCKVCTFAPGSINFAASVYYAQVTLTRSASTAPAPSLFSLRIF